VDFITVDVTTQCSLELPNSPFYFLGGITHNANWLLGEYFLVNSADNFMKSRRRSH